jgi:N-ethylmaleimide reductase
MSDSDPETTFLLFAEQLSDAGVGYLHLIEPVGGRMGNVSPEKRMASRIRQRFAGTLMLNGGYDAASGNAVIGRGEADLISFGELFLANPDLPGRFRQGMPLNKADPDTFYTGEEKGYTDYPVAGS